MKSSRAIRRSQHFALILGVALAACAGPGRFHTNAHFDTTYDFDNVHTFAFDVRREKVRTSDNGRLAQQALSDAMISRGYRKVSKAQADVLINYDIGVSSQARLDGSKGLQRSEGSLTVWVYDAKTGKEVWHGWAERVVTPQDEPEPAIRAAVGDIFDRHVPVAK